MQPPRRRDHTGKRQHSICRERWEYIFNKLHRKNAGVANRHDQRLDECRDTIDDVSHEIESFSIRVVIISYAGNVRFDVDFYTFLLTFNSNRWTSSHKYLNEKICFCRARQCLALLKDFNEWLPYFSLVPHPFFDLQKLLDRQRQRLIDPRHS